MYSSLFTFTKRMYYNEKTNRIIACNNNASKSYSRNFACRRKRNNIEGQNLFKSPNFVSSNGLREAPDWYIGTNTGTKWNGSVPDPKDKSNLIPLESITSGTSESNRGSSFYYANDSGTEQRNGYYLCENITSASGSYWNGKNALMCYIPIAPGKMYYFSYNISSWGNIANSSVRYGAINSDTYCNLASQGKISWSGTGGVNVDEYDGSNMTQKGSWTKQEAVITSDGDADYFFFNLYWLQDTSYVCINGFTLTEISPLGISHIENSVVTSPAGTKPNLPASVAVTYSNGMKGMLSVDWEDTYDIYKDGTYYVNGTVTSGSNKYQAAAELTVYSSSISPDYTIANKITYNNGLINADFGIYTDKTDKNLLTALALYNSKGALHSITTKDVLPQSSDEFRLTLSSPADDNYTAKAFVWDKETLIPIANADPEPITLTEGGQFMALSDVSLLDGMFKTAQDLNVNYLLAIDPDRLLAPCLDSSGLTPKAEHYGGWEAKQYGSWAAGNGISGHSLGHWMSAVSTAYQSSGNNELKKRLDYAVNELSLIQETTGSGYIGGIYPSAFESAFNGTVNAGGFDLNGAWVPWYSVHKIYQGLIDAYTIAGNEKALEVVIKFADWAVEGTDKMTDSQMQTMLNTEHGGMNDVFAQLYGITKNEKYLNTAVRFTHNIIIDPLSQEKDELTGKHANTQIPKVIGAAAIYEQDQIRTDYKTASEFFWDTVVHNRTFVIGGNSVSEHFESVDAETLHKKTCESCNTYNMIKLTEHLYSWEHKSEYMDYVENALYNDILGAQDPLTGNKMYFTSLLQGHYRVYGTPENSWWCCTGSGMENPGRYAKCIYYKDRSDLYVNLYIHSRAVWNETGLTLRMETNFPYSDSVKITVEKGSANASLHFRVPSWLNGAMTVRTSEEEYTANEPGYITVDRFWSEGDVIDITLPMGLSVYTSRDSENKVAFKYGPIVLGAPLGSDGLPNDTQQSELGIPDTTVSVPTLKTESSDPNDFISVSDLNSLTFTINGEYTSNGQDIMLMPFYGIHHQFHNVYWYLNSHADPYEKALNDITVDSVTPDGQQDEIGHDLHSKDSHNGSFVNGIITYYWRDAYGAQDSFFSYKMTVKGDIKNYLYVSYWGSDNSFKGYTRTFDILIDGEKISSQSLQSPSPGQPYNVFYDIPERLTQGKETVVVKFAVTDSNSCAGGVLDVRITDKGNVDI